MIGPTWRGNLASSPPSYVRAYASVRFEFSELYFMLFRGALEAGVEREKVKQLVDAASAEAV